MGARQVAHEAGSSKFSGSSRRPSDASQYERARGGYRTRMQRAPEHSGRLLTNLSAQHGPTRPDQTTIGASWNPSLRPSSSPMT